MSLDVEIYAAKPLTLADLLPRLPRSAEWSEYEGTLAYESDEWQVLVHEPPPDLAELHPDARYRVPLTLEPIGAPDEGKSFLEEVFEVVGSATDGVAVDLRTGKNRRF